MENSNTREKEERTRNAKEKDGETWNRKWVNWNANEIEGLTETWKKKMGELKHEMKEGGTWAQKRKWKEQEMQDKEGELKHKMKEKDRDWTAKGKRGMETKIGNWKTRNVKRRK